MQMHTRIGKQIGLSNRAVCKIQTVFSFSLLEENNKAYVFCLLGSKFHKIYLFFVCVLRWLLQYGVQAVGLFCSTRRSNATALGK